jgi:hypothetical protein
MVFRRTIVTEIANFENKKKINKHTYFTAASVHHMTNCSAFRMKTGKNETNGRTDALSE